MRRGLILVALEFLRGPAALLVPLDLVAQRAGRIFQRAELVDEHPRALAIDHDHAEPAIVIPDIGQRRDVRPLAEKDEILHGNQELVFPPEPLFLHAEAGDPASLPVILMLEEAFDALGIGRRRALTGSLGKQFAQ